MTTDPKACCGRHPRIRENGIPSIPGESTRRKQTSVKAALKRACAPNGATFRDPVT